MKKIFILLTFFLVAILNAQTITKERKVVQIMSPQTFYLNGGTKAAFGGKSRTWYPINLPSNTIEWYYSVSTTRGQNSSASLQLFSQLGRLLDPTGLTSTTASLILTPTGAGVCDSYLMNRKNADAFTEKVDNWGGTFYYMPSGSRGNYRNGTVQIKDITQGSWCLGFKNPSASEGISITIEVVAIVEETKVLEQTENQKKAEQLGNLGWMAYQRGDYVQCLELSRKALELDNEMGWVHANIGLVLLAQNNYMSAIDCYSRAIYCYSKSDKVKWYYVETIKDLDSLIEEKGYVEGASDIRALLENEYKKY